MSNPLSRKVNALVLVSTLLLCCSTGSTPRDSSANTITIASFNTLRLGRGTDKDLTKFAQVLSNFDVIGLQEVMIEDTLRKVRGILDSTTGVPWHYVISERSIGRTSYKEYYAILYRSDRTTYTSNSAVLWNDEGDLFEREPFFASFRSGNFDYTIIVMHSDFDSNKKVMRKEAVHLAGVFRAVTERDPRERDVILLGDFNLSAGDKGWDSVRAIPTMVNLISGKTLTTLSPSGALASAYDNIWIRTGFTRHEYADTAYADYYYKTMYSAAAQPGVEARKKISDHVPVWARFRTDRPDDD